tara:strand:- start:172 stop:795 length:624 start_codon:yes stop_codon:yes gene_type:complete
MIENYYKNEFGVISQIEISENTKYDEEYIAKRYRNYPQKCREMAHLRLGYIIGAIGAVPSSIMDIGYGSGEFLDVAKNIIPKCFGNDITGIKPPAGVEYIEDFTSIGVSVVTFFDVLEHFENPVETIKGLHCQYVAISVPHCHYYNDDWFRNWKHRRPNEHLHHFNEVSLSAMMNECGFVTLLQTNIEDTIRKDQPQNILTMVFERE